MEERTPGSEPADDDDTTESSPRRRWLLPAAIILSLATLLSAWSGYEASRWNSEFTRSSRTATVARIDAVTSANTANRQLTTDILLFTEWFKAEVEGNSKVADEVRLHFRKEFGPAFGSWLATSVDGSLPAGTPFDTSYLLAANVEADRLRDVATAATIQADRAGENADNYVLAAMLYASVLFLAGVSSKIPGRVSQILTTVLSGVAFLVAAGFTFSLPIMV